MKPISTVVSIATILLISTIFCSHSEEQCSWMPDGSQVCDNEETHNVWTEEHSKDEEYSKDRIKALMDQNTQGLQRLEAELIVNHVMDVSVNNPPAQVVKNALDSFSTIDKNDDGNLSEEEIQAFLEPREISDKSKILEEYAGNVLTILGYFEILGKLQQDYQDVLSPFKTLDFLAPVEVKKVIEGSVKMFLENDEDVSNGLNKKELLKSMARPENKRAQMMSLEQKEAIFTAIDRDQNGEVTYPEFQTILPPRPKDVTQNLQELFRNADLDVDGYLSEAEFEVHMKTMTLKMKTPTPKDNEIEEAFNKLDKDEDGKVSEVEMMGISEDLEKLQQEKSSQAFAEMDTDGDGQLSRPEVEVVAKSMAERSGQTIDAEMLIKMLDKNSDGIIQLDEIHTMVKRMNPTGK